MMVAAGLFVISEHVADHRPQQRVVSEPELAVGGDQRAQIGTTQPIPLGMEPLPAQVPQQGLVLGPQLRHRGDHH